MAKKQINAEFYIFLAVPLRVAKVYVIVIL